MKFKKLSLAAIGIFIFSTVIIFVVETYTYKNTINKVNRYSELLSSYITENRNESGAKFIEFIAFFEGFERVVVHDDRGDLFSETNNASNLGSFGKFLNNLNLIRKVSFESEIKSGGKNVGKIQVLWVNRNAFLYFWILALTVLLTAAHKIRVAFKASEKKYLEIFNIATEAFLVFDGSGRINEVNSSACNMYGYSQREFEGLMLENILHGDSINFFNTIVAECESKGRSRLNAAHLSKEQTVMDVEAVVAPFTYKGEVNYLATITNVTQQRLIDAENKEMQKKMYQTSKLSSIGLLSAGVAHEINNPLAIVQGNLEIMKDQLGDNVPNTYDRIFSGVERITNIVRALRGYAKDDDDEADEMNIHEAVEDSVNLIGSIYEKKGIKIETKLNSKNPMVFGNASKIQMVFMNLISNAKDAIESWDSVDMPRKDPNEGGVIKIETEDVPGIIILKFVDNGIGISKKNIDKIYDAFYSTKEQGKGSGLGLSVSHSIIESLGGEIHVNSKLGEGTVFTITLPSCEPEVGDIDKEVEAKPKQVYDYRRIDGHALVVDDEPDIRELMCECLEAFGLDVDTASDGVKAMEKLKINKYDYLITDIIMPNMDGVALLTKVKELGIRDTRCIIITGGVFTEHTPEYRKNLRTMCHSYIKKPFRKEEIYQSLITP
jgi:two-component system NtrC family sensor kinase